MGKLMSEIDLKYSLPVDYVKSCPYLMSFMRRYKLKEQIEKYFKNHPEEVDIANKKLLWINKSKIDKYEELPETNARLEQLKEKSIVSGAEKYLWVPPSKPYYQLQGVYKNSSEFSKILVFSSWEMVPRMIGAMISYEAERLTIGKLSRQSDNVDRKNAHYFAEGSKRYPASRLRFNVTNGEAKGMSLFCILYPSDTLASLYNPISAMNDHLTLAQIEKNIRVELNIRLKRIQDKYGESSLQRQDDRWYYLAPMIMDGKEYVQSWINEVIDTRDLDEEDSTAERGSKGLVTHIERLNMYLNDENDLKLGKMPDDLLDTLVNMVIGSPANCVYRSNGCNAARATEISKVFVNNFNLTESTAIIDLSYGRCKDDNSHWQNVLKYCKDGCFQAMLDEYMHMLGETVGFSGDEDKDALIHHIMMDSLRIHTATYTVDTFPTFKKRISGQKERSIGIRSSYAVGFTKDAGDNSKIVNRKESIRNAFNSPLRPFVLATTSIGQEGLDFHNYCRVIMHWNLPSNPIDLEASGW